MADAAVTFLLDNVSHLLESYADLISGAEDELQQLRTELYLFRAFLRESANKSKKDEPFRKMERRIREVVYVVEDTIDFCLTQAAAAKGKNNLLRRDLNTKSVSLAEVVRSLREDKVKPLFDEAKMFFADMKIGDGSGTSMEEPPQAKVKEVLSIRQDRVVGIIDEERTIINYLMEPTEALDFISITGMGGLGKTTLARKIFQNQKIQYEFPTRIWVYISQEYDMKNVFLNILKEVTSKDMSSMSDHELVLTVGDFLERRKFLLVLDDVWSFKLVAAIQDVLPKSNRMSRVLITSRLTTLATTANLTRAPHEMRLLNANESWELLELRVFGEPHGCPPELIGIGRDIAKQLRGLPLQILIIGGVLVNELSRTQSMSALIETWKGVYYAIRFRNKSEVLGVGLFHVLTLGYNYLFDDLRDCFLYLGMFPEDYEISAWTLTRLWIAEGFIQHKEGQSLEETAEENLKHLINRNLVMVDKVRPDGKVKTCRVHDSVREICLRESHRNANLFQEIRKSHRGIYEPSNSDVLDFFSSEPYFSRRLFLHSDVLDSFPFSIFYDKLKSDLEKHRRLCIHSDVLDFFSSEPYFPGARSFLCFSKNESTLLPEDTSKIPRAFELLRVLDVRSIRFTRFPLELTLLVHLRYIALSSDFKVLPEAVSKLRNTQTLIIHTSSRTLLIKADIWKMIQLRHLKTNASIILLKTPENSGGGQELQTLCCLSPQNCTNDVFKQARYLKKLAIRGTLSILLDGEVGSRKFDIFEKLKDLENLKLLNDIHISSPSEGRLSCLPPPDMFPPKLRSLTLSATFLNWEHMSVLGMLENLEVLKLKDNAFVGECWEVVDGGFPSLEVLQIGYTNLVFWKASGHHFPRLRCLMLRNCEELEALPEGLATVLNLQVIDLHRPSKTAAASARKIQREILHMEGNSRSREFKLSIYPSDELFPNDDKCIETSHPSFVTSSGFKKYLRFLWGCLD